MHYIDSAWQLQSHCLGTTYLVEDHTGENIKESLLETLKEWNLDTKSLVAMTTDSGSNVKRACTLLNWRRLSCFGHNLDLGVRKALNDARVTRVLRVCRQVVAKFSQSWKKKRDLASAQHERELPLHKLKADCQTRWGSSLSMLQRIAEQQEAIRVVLATDRKASHLIPTWQDFEVIDSVIDAIGPLGELTDALSAEKNITISAVRPLLTRLSREVLQEKDTDSSLTEQLKRVVRVDLESRYADSDLSTLLDICTFLDPRFKPAQPDESTIEVIKGEMLKSAQANPLPTPQECESSAESPPPLKKKKTWLHQILGATTEGPSAVPLSPSERVAEEMCRYLHHPKVDVECSPLEWWKVQEKQLPLLSMQARRYLCVCATSVPSERVFSAGGNIVTDSRNSLKPHTVDQLVFLATNLK